MKYGLSEEQAKQYWIDRFAKQGERTVDFVKHDKEQAFKLSEERINFLFNSEGYDEAFCPRSKRTLDFGCGIGRYSVLFEKEKYMGVDINPNIIGVAKNKYPNRNFFVYVPFEFNVEVVMFNPQTIFTCTVLQHCDDEFVKKIFESFIRLFNDQRIQKRCFYFYENSKARVSHVCGRSFEEYYNLLNIYFEIEEWHTKTHIVHNEKHTVCKFYVFC